MASQLQDIASVWPSISSIFSIPHTASEYENLVSLLDGLIGEVGENEGHPLSSLMETIGNLIETYENNNLRPITGTPREALQYLMKEHGLKQSDLHELGSQGVVSEIMSGKRSLNIRQIKALSNRFGVSPIVFIPEN